eukprot:GFUD01016075.1.p1 GENE.GFUD01016075.1~~GFUD01016075.1.p1  ORF type:complete len:159 (-),score=60.09 GFUD01016075.1:142-618(-)
MDLSYHPSHLPNVNPQFLPNPPTMGQVLTVVGGRVVSRNSQFPINGQQLMMQVDSLTCAMTDMTVTTEEGMEETSNETEQGILQQKLYQQQQQLLQHQQQVEHLRQLQLEQQGRLQQQQIPICGHNDQKEGGRLIPNSDKPTMSTMSTISTSRCAMMT